MHPGPPRKKLREERVNHRYRRDQPGLPCAVVYGLYVLSPVNQHLPPSPARCETHRRELSACMGAPGPHDFAVRKCAVRPSAHLASTALRSTFVTTRNAPHVGAERANYRPILFSVKQKSFLPRRLDRIFASALVGQINCAREHAHSRGRPLSIVRHGLQGEPQIPNTSLSRACRLRYHCRL